VRNAVVHLREGASSWKQPFDDASEGWGENLKEIFREALWGGGVKGDKSRKQVRGE